MKFSKQRKFGHGSLAVVEAGGYKIVIKIKKKIIGKRLMKDDNGVDQQPRERPIEKAASEKSTRHDLLFYYDMFGRNLGPYQRAKPY